MMRSTLLAIRKVHGHNGYRLGATLSFPRKNTFSAAAYRPLSTLSSFNFSDEVRSALEQKKPLVALESTIISHGMPYPQNYDTALQVEQVVRDNGAIPATIAILGGQVHIGLSNDQIRDLAKLGRRVVKASRRDLAVVVSKKQTGATTVSGTMVLAHRAGISVFATGGIGGVHRGYENTMDASADLTELGRTPVAVVCAGVKSILDIGRTLEFLETQGVTVATYGSTPDFPAFFTRTSGFQSMLNIETSMDAAKIIAANQELDLQSGIVFSVPIPEDEAMDDALVDEAIDIAVKESIQQNIVGKESTPFLLKRVNELTGGNSLKSNIALVKHNASVAAKIAKDLSAISARSTIGGQRRSYSTSARRLERHRINHDQVNHGPIMVIGGAVVDITSTATVATADSMLGSSYPGITRNGLGGVGRNVAEGISRLNPESCIFVTAVGGRAGGSEANADADTDEDVFGQWLIDRMALRGMNTQEIHQIPSARTATYVAIHDATGNLLSAIADMVVFELMPLDKVREAILRHRPGTVCFDGNLSIPCMRTILEMCRDQDIHTFFEPTSEAKCGRVLDASLQTFLKDGLLRFASPNEYELRTMAARARELNGGYEEQTIVQRYYDDNTGTISEEQEFANYKDLLLDATAVSQFIPTLFIKLGSSGVLVCQRTSERVGQQLNIDTEAGVMIWQPFFAHKVDNIKSVSGAGDSFVASMVTSLHSMGKNKPSSLPPSQQRTGIDPSSFWKQLSLFVKDAQTAATLTLQTHETISPALATTAQAKRLRLSKKC
ncbi:hypothetical protein BG011_008545 [Mortierella polycephala]|uniref:Carbohydrate kinase PfkB domain-containing protein n=1 Tax=Mortierella polycephala TaxID=41804 RepID=A0A9P6Q9G5_9FUNG|nr:hypothetical protein BG011_008545 [Mortierella polycephala]